MPDLLRRFKFSQFSSNIMDAEIIQKSGALLAVMARLTEMADLPDPAQGIAAARLAHVTDYLQTVCNDFVQLTAVREQAVSDAETRAVQRTLDDGAARAVAAEKLEALRAEAEQTAASSQERASELDNREADLEKREAKLDNSLDALKREKASLASDLDGRKADLEKREAELRNGASELDDRKADLEKREAELVNGVSQLDDQKADLEKREAELVEGLDAMQRREDNLSRAQEVLAGAREDLATAQEDLATAEEALATAEEALASERTKAAEERVGIWMARNAVAEDVSALEDLKKRFQKSQQDAADHVTDAKLTSAKLTSQMENLCTSLAACSTGADVCGRLDEIGDRMSGLEQKAVSPADLESVRVAVVAAVDAAVERDAVAVAHAPRKRRRVGSPEPSRWLQLVAAVASDMQAVAPEELEEDNPGLKMIYFELSVVSLRPLYKAHWVDFVQSGVADVWHCLHSIFDSGEGAVADDGCCRLHEQTCLRVLLRREGGVVRTLFTTPDAS